MKPSHQWAALAIVACGVCIPSCRESEPSQSNHEPARSQGPMLVQSSPELKKGKSRAAMEATGPQLRADQQEWTTLEDGLQLGTGITVKDVNTNYVGDGSLIGDELGSLVYLCVISVENLTGEMLDPWVARIGYDTDGGVIVWRGPSQVVIADRGDAIISFHTVVPGDVLLEAVEREGHLVAEIHRAF